jgi:hypothetical protein
MIRQCKGGWWTAQYLREVYGAFETASNFNYSTEARLYWTEDKKYVVTLELPKQIPTINTYFPTLKEARKHFISLCHEHNLIPVCIKFTPKKSKKEGTKS